MRWLRPVLFLLLTSCAGTYWPHYEIGKTKDGAQLAYSSMLGGPNLRVHPNGRIVWFMDSGAYGLNKPLPREIFDKTVWIEIQNIVRRNDGLDITDELDESIAFCDGGAVFLWAKVGDKTAHFVQDNDNCGPGILKSDKAGRQIVNLMEKLEEQLRAMSANDMRK